MIEKNISIYNLSNEYSENGKCGIVRIKLEINYLHKHFDIFPSIGDSFKFKSEVKQNLKWKTILILINEAIDFANNKLDIKE